MPAAEDWTTGEIVRTLERIAGSMERVEGKVDGLRNEFVPRELHARELSHITGRADELGLRVADVEAELMRFRKEVASRGDSRWQYWTGLIVIAVLSIVGGIVVRTLTGA